MKTYQDVQLEIVYLEIEDAIRCSGDCDYEPDGGFFE